MHIRGDLQVDGAILDKSGDPVSPSDNEFAPSIDNFVMRTDLGDYDLSSGYEIIPLVVDKPFIVQVHFAFHTTPSRVDLGSYNGIGESAMFVGDVGSVITYVTSLILAKNESYYIVRTGGDATLSIVYERPLV